MAKTSCNLSNKSSTFMGVLVIFMLLVQGGSAQRLYTCWGGCLNECFLLSSKQFGQRFPCYVNCLARCFYPPGFGTPSAPTPPSTPAPAASPDSSLEADSEEYADSFIDTNFELQAPRADKQNYCLMECSLQTCGLRNLDETVFKKCLLGCISKCKDLSI